MSEEQVKMEEIPEISAEDIGFDPEHLIGQTLAGRYEIEQRIGRGGMGVVYLASQNALNRKVVVKVLSGALSGEEEAVARFEREALGLSQLQHPNIVTIYDFGRDKDLAYIVMEYVEGETLSQFVRRQGPVPFDEFAAIGPQILDALAEAHSQGIIHRDIKPSNIMLCERHGHANVVKVLDFGLAKLLHDAAEVTKKQNLVGSVAFLAPEQILGLEFDQRVDVYALGVLFYYMLTGQKPFRGEDDMAVLYQHIHKTPAPLHEQLGPNHQVPTEIITLIHRCLSKDPRDRPRDAREFLSLIQSDLSQSVFHTPWATGEFAAMRSGPQSRPSGIVQTPSGAHPITSPSGHYPTSPHSGLIALSPSTEMSSPYHMSHAGMSNPYLEHPPPRRGLSSMLLGLILLAVLGVGGAIAYNMSLGGARHTRVLDDVQSLVNKKEWNQAGVLLETTSESQDPDVMRRRASLTNLIEIGKMETRAAALEASGYDSGARKLYREILMRDATHAGAKARLAALDQEGTPEAVMGSVKVDSSVKGRVSVDGTFIGYTPVTSSFEAGTHEVTVTAKGHQPWSKTITLEEGQSLILDAELVSGRGGTATSRRGPRKKKRSTARKKSVETETGSGPTAVGAAAATKSPSDKKNGLLFELKKKKEKKKPPIGLLPVN